MSSDRGRTAESYVDQQQFHPLGSEESQEIATREPISTSFRRVSNVGVVGREMVYVDNIAVALADARKLRRVRQVLVIMVYHPRAGFLMRLPKAALIDGQLTMSPIQCEIEYGDTPESVISHALADEASYALPKEQVTYVGSVRSVVPPLSQSPKAKDYDFQMLHFWGHEITSAAPVPLPVGDELTWNHVHNFPASVFPFVSTRKREPLAAAMEEFLRIRRVPWRAIPKLKT